MLYDKIQDLCRKNGTCIRRVEMDCKIGNGTIRYWNTSSPRVDKLKAVADYFGLTINDLVYDAPKP